MNNNIENMKFDVRFSGTVWWITTCIYIFFLSILFHAFMSIKEVGGFAYVVLLVMLIVFICIIIYGYRYRIYCYVLKDNRLLFENPQGRYLGVALGDISAVEIIRSPFGKSIRLVGNWGLYGFYGEFKQIGGPNFTAYVTDTKNCVMLHMKGGERIVISPHEREQFLATLAALRPDLPIKAEG